MDNIISNGTEVLIFRYIPGWGMEQDNINFIKGIVQKSYQSADLSQHGSPWVEQIYEVLGEDGKVYTGNYDSGIIGDSFFRTAQDQISFLQRMIQNNCSKIENLENINKNYNEQIRELKQNNKIKTKVL